jgi:predicted ATP-dependent serine protease
VAVGEVSLSGEALRRVSPSTRVREAAQLGFARIGVPAAQADDVALEASRSVPLATLRRACEQLLSGSRETPPPGGDS